MLLPEMWHLETFLVAITGLWKDANWYPQIKMLQNIQQHAREYTSTDNDLVKMRTPRMGNSIQRIPMNTEKELENKLHYLAAK